MKKEIDLDLLAKLNKAFIEYYAKAEKFKTEENFLAWLSHLDIRHPELRKDFERAGFEESKNAIPFMRFVLELNSIGLYEHMQHNLSCEDYKRFIAPNSDLVIPKEMNIVNPNDLTKLI